MSAIWNDGEEGRGTETMARVTVTAKFENVGHCALVKRGPIPADQIPWIEVSDALVDPSVVPRCMPTWFVQQFDLMPLASHTKRIGPGLALRRVYGAVRLNVQDRECTTDVVDVPNAHPVLIGRNPLQRLEFVIDPPGLSVIGYPEHGGEQRISSSTLAANWEVLNG